MAANAMIVDHRDVGAAFRRLSLPFAVSMLGDQLLGIVDTIAIGSLGSVALAGLTGATTVFIAVVFATSGFISGLAIIAAQRIGANDLDGFAATVRSGLLVPLATALAAALLSLVFAPAIVGAMVGHIASAHASGVYLILRCFSLVPIVISGTIIAGLSAAGNRRIAVAVLALINLIHIPLLLILALGWLTHHPFGIAGAGLSSLLSEIVAAIYAVWYVWRRPQYRILSATSINVRLAMQCARLGLPESVFLFSVVAPDSFVVALLAPFGPVFISAFRALTIVSDLTFVVPSPLQSAVQTVIGQRLGAKDVPGALHFFHRARKFAFLITSATGLLCAALAWPLAFIFTLNATIASVAALPLALHMATLPIKGWAMVSMAPIRAAGDTRFSMTVGIVCALLFVPVAYVCIHVLRIGLYGVPIGWIVAWSARAILTYIKLRRASWTQTRLIAV